MLHTLHSLLLAVYLGSALTVAATPTQPKEPPLSPSLSPKCASCSCGCATGKACTCQGKDLAGVYLVSGRETTSERANDYSGVTVLTRFGEAYRVASLVAGNHVVGLAVRQGDMLAVSWQQKDGGGVTLYRIQGSTLSGRWASIPGDGRLQSEVLHFLKALPKGDD